MRKPKTSGATAQRAAVNRLKQRAYADGRRDATDDAVREVADEFEESKRAREAAEADDSSSGSSGGGRSGFGLNI